MEKLIECKTCGKEIAKNAKVCPHCGAKNKKKHPVLIVVLILFVLLIVIIATSGNDSEPKKVGGSTSESVPPTQGQSVEGDRFGVGDSAELNDVVVSLTSVTENSGAEFNKPADGKVFVLCEFDIENNSSKDIGVSSMISFEAYFDDYSTNQSLSALLTAKDKNQLDGSVAAGKKMNGVIGYEVPADWSSLEIRFAPDFWGKDITFVYSK